MSRRFKLLQADLPGIVQRLAQATERYARAILQGDTSQFAEVMLFYTQKLRTQGYWIP